tara:strand:+ start:651 stop:1370 length:720 start_codon:yes stop_codon:yes gene_type:complete
MTNQDERLTRARGYPYPYPGHSYIWRNGEVTDFELQATTGRTAVLAVGSNRAPLRLGQKYLGKTDLPIPVQHAKLKDFDIVYAAHLTRYGSVPAMLQHAPGTTIELAVTWLNSAQLEIMHATEGGYYYAEIEPVELVYDDGTRSDSVHLYVGREGHLVHEEQPIALIEIDGKDRPHPACNTAKVLEIVHARVAPGMSLDAFILKVIDDTGFRRECSTKLTVDSVPFDYPYKKKLGGLAD